MSREKKKWSWKRFSIKFIVVVVIILAGLQFGLGLIIKNAAEKIGPQFTGTPIKVEKANIRPFSGHAEFRGVLVGPPQNTDFKADVFKLDTVRVSVNIKSLFSDVIVVKEIAVIAPEVTYELSGLNSNVNQIMKNLGTGEKKESKPKKEKISSKKVIIEHFVFSGGKVRLAASTLGGKGVPISMPTLELHDIGKKSGGVTALDASVQIMTSIVSGTVNLATDAIVGVGGLAVEAVSTGAELVGEAAGAVGGAAVDGVKAVGGAIGSGLSAINPFSSSKKTEEKDGEEKTGK